LINSHDKYCWEKQDVSCQPIALTSVSPTSYVLHYWWHIRVGQQAEYPIRMSSSSS
jgi:hypothetical protein